MNENDASIFASKIRLLESVFGWGTFTISILFPLFVVTSIYLSNIFLFLIYVVVLFGFYIIMVFWIILISKSRFNFWIDVEILNQFFNTVFPGLSGWIISSFLFWWFFMLSGFFSLIFVFLICINGSLLPLCYFLSRYLKWRSKGEWRKFVRGKSEEIEDVVRKALGSLKLKYSRVMEGSRWTMLISSYRIEDSGISLKVWKAGRRVAVINTKVLSASEIPKAREIEERIDSLIDIIKR